jgi:DNA-binding CsgD family transcriptional regulator
MPAELRWPGRDLQLTERESELLALLPTGMTNRELGAHLCLSQNTIKTQLRSLFFKLHVRNRAQAVALASSGTLGEWQSQDSAAAAPGNTRTRPWRTLTARNTVTAGRRGSQTIEGHEFAC